LLLLFRFLVDPNASANNIHNAQVPQTPNLTQNYSSQATNHHFDMSYNSSSSSSANNFNNFTQFPMQYQPQQQQTDQYGGQQQYQDGNQMYQQQQQQFHGQSTVVATGVMQQQQHQHGLHGPTSTYQHSINDLLVQPTATLQQNLFNSESMTSISSNQSVSLTFAMRLITQAFFF